MPFRDLANVFSGGVRETEEPKPIGVRLGFVGSTDDLARIRGPTRLAAFPHTEELVDSADGRSCGVGGDLSVDDC